MFPHQVRIVKHRKVLAVSSLSGNLQILRVVVKRNTPFLSTSKFCIVYKIPNHYYHRILLFVYESCYIIVYLRSLYNFSYYIILVHRKYGIFVLTKP